MEVKKHGEMDVWIDEADIPRLMSELSELNDIKFDESEIISRDEDNNDVRIALFYRLFEDIVYPRYPKQTYYQLNNDFIN